MIAPSEYAFAPILCLVHFLFHFQSILLLILIIVLKI